MISVRNIIDPVNIELQDMCIEWEGYDITLGEMSWLKHIACC
jgi:hypothetical protein